MADSGESQMKIVNGEAGYVLEDVPHLTDHIPDLPVNAPLSLSSPATLYSYWIRISQCTRAVCVSMFLLSNRSRTKRKLLLFLLNYRSKGWWALFSFFFLCCFLFGRLIQIHYKTILHIQRSGKPKFCSVFCFLLASLVFASQTHGESFWGILISGSTLLMWMILLPKRFVLLFMLHCSKSFVLVTVEEYFLG